jgi:hypothetical protein
LLEELKPNYEGIVVGPNVTLVLDYAVPMRLVCLIREAQKQPPRNLAGDTYRLVMVFRWCLTIPSKGELESRRRHARYSSAVIICADSRSIFIF